MSIFVRHSENYWKGSDVIDKGLNKYPLSFSDIGWYPNFLYQVLLFFILGFYL